MYKNNVIDITERSRKSSKGSKSQNSSEKGKADVTDITEMRQEIIQEERRDVKRTILTGFIGAFVVIPEQGLLRVDIYDISENGIAFDMEADNGFFNTGEEIAMRVYMNQNTYFPFIIKVQNSRALKGADMTRHGASFMKGTVNDEALHHFVKFIETVSASLEKDNGDVLVSNLKK